MTEAPAHAEHARYGKLNMPYIASWANKPMDEPMWALNLMSYREIAEYAISLPATASATTRLSRPTGRCGWRPFRWVMPTGSCAAGRGAERFA